MNRSVTRICREILPVARHVFLGVTSLSSAAAGTSGTTGTRRDRRGDGVHFGNAHAPQVRAGLQVTPIEAAGRTIFKVAAQRCGIVVVQQFKRLAGFLGIEAFKDQRVAVAGGDLANVDLGGSDRSHVRSFQG